MQPGYSHFNEEKLGRRYDLRLIRRLIPFGYAYRWLFAGAVLLVILITVLDISIPYITKIAIDRHIVPNIGRPETGGGKASSGWSGYYPVAPDSSTADAIVRQYPDRFTARDGRTYIAYKELSGLTKTELIRLRETDLQGVLTLATGLLLIVISVFALNFVQVLLMEYTGQRIMHDLRMKLFTHIQSLPMKYFAENPVGRLVTRITNDIQNMHEMFTSVITFVFKDVFLLAGITIVLLQINLKLALVTLTVLPVLLLIAVRFAGMAREAFRVLRVKIAEINSRISESIEGIRIVQLFGQELNNYLRLKQLNHEHYLAGMRQIKVFAVFMPLIELMGSVAVAIIIYYGGRGVLQDSISLGSLAAFIFYMRMFFRPIRDIAEKVNILQNALASAERIFLILDHEKSAKQPIDPALQLSEIETLAFEKVTFAYDPGINVLADISFAMQKGGSLAVVGPTGAGKTSLINLIIRFYNPQSGTIRINGQDIQDLPEEELRRRIALVTQDPFLFAGTVRENIVGARTDLPEEVLHQALEIANCLPLIRKLPDGLDTVLSERAGSISSGERQLLSIARAIAHQPDLIILDEATSYVDSDTERKIQIAMEKLLQERTTLVIAHRLSTARKADRIVVLKKGRIVEMGSHVELMEEQGLYYQLNQLQG